MLVDDDVDIDGLMMKVVAAMRVIVLMRGLGDDDNADNGDDDDNADIMMTMIITY